MWRSIFFAGPGVGSFPFAMATDETLKPYQSEYIDNALKWDILRFGGPFTLKSGRKSPYFFNAGLFNSGMKLQMVAECYANRIVDSGVEFDVLFGPAYKACNFANSRVSPLSLRLRSRLPRTTAATCRSASTVRRPRRTERAVTLSVLLSKAACLSSTT